MKVVIIHGYQGVPNGGFRPWLKKELEARGFEVRMPAMPTPDAPRLEEWVATIGREAAGENCILVGHSLGCTAILRYLEQVKKKVAGAVLVAGFAERLGDGFEATENFVDSPLDFARVRKNCSKMVAIFSDNDPYVPLDRGDIIKEKLGAEVIVKHNAKHFSGPVDNESSCTKLPDVVDAIMKFSN